ncbi:MAG TPA: stage II sporulation protein M [Vicinamibacteria bacterium]|nr:stage II sporulation protein M [Vicinamibacteria bacterium]
MKSLEFRREREGSWVELEALIARVEGWGLGILTAAELSRLPVLYRATLSSLSVARAISLDANVVEYLESLAARAYVCVYGAKRPAREAARRFLAVRFPATVRALRRQLALSAALMLLGTVTGLGLTAADPNRFYALVDEDSAQGRTPASTTEELRQVLYDDKQPADLLGAFAMYLFTHNARVGMLCAALGFAAGVPVMLLLFTNGLLLGAFAALYQGRGLGIEFWAWILPHGVTELLAVVLCGAAGLAVGESLLFPGRHTRLVNMGLRGREAGIVVLGAVLMLLLAGLVEGIFRQTVHDVFLRLSVAILSAAFWAVYFTRVGRGRME